LALGKQESKNPLSNFSNATTTAAE